MKIDKAGLKLIKRYEGFSGKPYLDDALVPTIGYGTTHYGIDGRAVTLDDVTISKDTASYLLESQINETYGRAVNHAVRVPINQNQYDALVSFTYNVGVAGLHASNVLKYINKGKLAEADTQFSHWNHVNGKVDRGLTHRRLLEARLFRA